MPRALPRCCWQAGMVQSEGMPEDGRIILSHAGRVTEKASSTTEARDRQRHEHPPALPVQAHTVEMSPFRGGRREGPAFCVTLCCMF